MPDTCGEERPDGTVCGRPVHSLGVCEFHNPALMEKLSADEVSSRFRAFLEEEDQKDSVDRIYCYKFFLPGLDLQGNLEIATPVRFEECEFPETPSFRDTRFDEVAFIDCDFGDLTVSGSALPSAEFRKCRFDGPVKIKHSALGKVEIDDCTFREQVHIGGSLLYDLEATSNHCLAPFSLSGNIIWQLNLRDCTFSEDAVLAHNTVRIGATLNRAEFRKRLDVNRSDIHVLELRDARLTDCDIWHCDIAYLDASRCRCPGDVEVVSCRVSWLGMRRARIRGRFRLQDLVVKPLESLLDEEIHSEDLERGRRNWVSSELSLLKMGMADDLPYVDLTDVDILPEGILELVGRSQDLDLSRFLFLHTDVRRVRFERVAWAGRHRHVVFDEETLRDHLGDGGSPSAWSPKHVAELYRRLRINYENALRYDEAGDFFIGEMEMKRLARAPGSSPGSWLRRNGSLLSAYRLLARYGQSPRRVGAWIAGLYTTVVGLELLSNLVDKGNWLADVQEAIVHGALVLLNIPSQPTALDRVFGVIALFLFGLLFVTLRQKLMRPSQVAP